MAATPREIACILLQDAAWSPEGRTTELPGMYGWPSLAAGFGGLAGFPVARLRLGRVACGGVVHRVGGGRGL